MLSFSATSCAVFPLIPASISSNISVLDTSVSAITLLIASMILDNSPPDAIFARGFISSPGLVDIINLTLSVPVESGFFSSNSASNLTSRKLSCFKAFIISCEKFSAVFFLWLLKREAAFISFL